MALDFMAWPSIARLNRDMVVTEKIDGTNAAVIIESHGVHPEETVEDYTSKHASDYATFLTRPAFLNPGTSGEVAWEGYREVFEIGAQSRKRLLKPGDDNFAFAKWVWENADALLNALGEGRHFGEWWGSGIQRGYGLAKGEKRFSLFNVKRYGGINFPSYGLDNVATVPVLWTGPFSMETIEGLVEELRRDGSFVDFPHARFDNPEGVVVYHVAANQLFKVTCTDDEKPKSLVNA